MTSIALVALAALFQCLALVAGALWGHARDAGHDVAAEIAFCLGALCGLIALCLAALA